ncbi:hypothetical protein H2O64_06485 [Kordia sp. YSTF-M3]|uniref:Glycosyltransferase RgtA/B/C/D-like domain-containing protein n=1 Tax=Kordia aestuariivivens TaxID=2759037 RepID=A0ABR7Q7I0_9FLAO|nr:hypothetical protein [Kordia aestuariivivens]MBC8754311.1 hypothetical protein [Kordia aestuariivivens]
MKFLKQKSNIAIGILFLITLVVVLRNPIVYFPDSTGYLNMHIIRAPGYPLFLQFMKLLFGTGFDTATIVFQAIFGCFSIYFFIHKLRSHQLINDFFSVCFAIILLFPFVSGGKIANSILSEAIAYSLYLLIIGYYISFFISKNKKQLLYALPLLALLLITRYQFIYLVPLGLLLIFWVSFKKREFKKYSIQIALFLLLPLVVSLIDKTYHKITHDHFVSTPWTGMNLITPVLFVADAEDEAIFETEQEKEFFRNTYKDLATEKMNINHLELAQNETPTLFYISNFARITMGPIFKNGNASLDPTLSENEKYIALNKMTSKMVKPLVFDNFSKWKRIYVRNMLFGFGGIKQALLYFLLAFCSFFALLKRDQAAYKVLFVISLLFISNIIVVAIGMHAVVRFTFYNDWVLFLTIFILLNSLNKKLYES